MHNLLKKIKVYAINLIVFIFLVESALFIYYWVRNGKAVSASSEFEKTFLFDSLGTESCSWGDMTGPHPYFGLYYPNKISCKKSSRNSIGIAGPEIPIEYDANYYTLLITGASVAEQIAITTADNTTKNYLEYILNKNWLSPTQKPFRVISAAIAGAQQPVTSIQATLFGRFADAVISLEGYNEHFAYQTLNRIEQPTPAWLDFAYLNESPINYYFNSTLLSFIPAIKRSFLKNSFSVLAFSHLLYTVVSTYRNKIHERMAPFPNYLELTNEKRSSLFLNSYKDFLLQTSAAFSYQKKPFVLFIQPSPSRFKRLTQEELVAIGDLSHQEIYEPIKKTLKTLSEKNITVFSLEKVFENIDETLYVDHIHTNPNGVKLLSSAIAERLAQNYGYKRKQE